MTFKKDAKIVTDDFWYDLTDGGFIKPEDVLEPMDAHKVSQALRILQEFQQEAEKKGIIEYC